MEILKISLVFICTLQLSFSKDFGIDFCSIFGKCKSLNDISRYQIDLQCAELYGIIKCYMDSDFDNLRVNSTNSSINSSYSNNSSKSSISSIVFNATVRLISVDSKDDQNSIKRLINSTINHNRSYSNHSEDPIPVALTRHLSNSTLEIKIMILKDLNQIILYPSIQPNSTYSNQTKYSASCLDGILNDNQLREIIPFNQSNLQTQIKLLVNRIKSSIQFSCQYQQNGRSTISSLNGIATKSNGTSDDKSKVTILVPVVIICFVVFSCVLIMRFCHDGESSLMIQAKVMKYHPEKDKQLLNLIYEQIHKESEANSTNFTTQHHRHHHQHHHHHQSRRSSRQSISNNVISNVSQTKIPVNIDSNKPSNNLSKKLAKVVSTTSTKSVLNTSSQSSQPCCSKDLSSCPLMSTIACGLAPIKKSS